MKSFKQFIKNPPIEKDSKGRFIIHHSNIGIEKIYHKDKKERNIIDPKQSGITETFYEPTDKSELSKLTKKVKGLHQRLHDYYDAHNNDHAKKMSQRYSLGSYGINDTLHRLHTCNINHSQLSEGTKTLVNNIDEMHNKVKPAPEDFDVYTGIKWNPSHLFKAEEHSDEFSGHKKEDSDKHTILHFPAYTSTSIWSGKALGFSNSGENEEGHIIRIKIPKGSKHDIYMDGASSFGTHIMGDKAEKEFLLKRGLSIRLSKTPERDGNNHIWHGEVVEHDPIPLDIIPPEASPEELLGHSKNSNPDIRMAVATHKNVTPEISKRLSLDHDENVKRSVIDSKHTHPNVLHEMLSNNLHHVKRMLLNYNIHDSTIHDITTKHFPDDFAIHERVAFHPRTTEKTFGYLINKYKGKKESEQRKILDRIARHKHASVQNLLQIAKTNPTLYQNSIRENPNANDDVLDYLDSEGV
jgi:hypothetical protein